MKPIAVAILCFIGLSGSLTAQVCDPTVAPTGLTSTYTPGSGALLEWDAVPGSVGVQVKVTSLSDGVVFTQRNIVFERDWLLIPEVRFSPGNYTWQVQAACSTVPPYSVTPISASNSFTVEGGSSCPATVTDIDGNVYNTVEIGGQCWMKENLKVERYQNGDAIPSGLSSSAWFATTSGAVTVYNNVAVNKPIYGLLYNWYAAVDSRGLCPTGWHVPTDGEWTQMVTVLDPSTCGSCTGLDYSLTAGEEMKTTGTLSAGTGLWEAPNEATTNSSGFSALPGGLCFQDGSYNLQGILGFFWSSSGDSPDNAWRLGLISYNGIVFRVASEKRLGYSVRCLRD